MQQVVLSGGKGRLLTRFFFRFPFGFERLQRLFDDFGVRADVLLDCFVEGLL
jgi:hypothetical protein